MTGTRPEVPPSPRGARLKATLRRLGVPGILALLFLAIHVWQVTWVPQPPVNATSLVLGGPVPSPLTRVLWSLSHKGVLPVVAIVLDSGVLWLSWVLARRFRVSAFLTALTVYLALSAFYYVAMTAPLLNAVARLS